MKPWPRIEAPAALLLGTLACVTPAGDGSGDGSGNGTGSTPKGGQESTLSGRLLTRYRGRFAGGEDDHDLYETVDLTWRDPEQGLEGVFLARAALDLDGRDDDEDASFFGLQDTYDNRLQPQLYHAYLDVASESLSLLRLGRQPLYTTPVTVLLDGVRAEVEAGDDGRSSLGFYGGVGEHLYESDSGGDIVVGTFGATRAWSGAELRVDWMRLEDARLGVQHENDLFGLVLSQDLRAQRHITRLEARFTSLEGNGRDLRLSASHVDDRARSSLRGSVYQLLQTQKQLAAPLDPFSDSLFELFPYTQLDLAYSKDWEHLGLLTGADLRRVTDSSDEGTYNRNFERYYLTGFLTDVLPVSLSLTSEIWRATDSDHDTWGATISRELEEGWDVTLGTYYALFEYDLFTGEERDHVRSTYLDLRWKTDKARRWTLRYEFENNDFDDYHRVRLDYSWTF